MDQFSLNSDVLRDIFKHASPYGHNERRGDLNLGFGFIYYGLVRALAPYHTLVIGSGHGFSVVCLALAMKDNARGMLTFVDPSYSLMKDGPMKGLGGRGTWNEPEGVKEKFAKFGVEDVVTHYRMRNDEFFQSYHKLGLPQIDLAFIDGSHSHKDVQYDFNEIVSRSNRNTYLFLHDTNIYIRELLGHAGVKRWINVIKKEETAFEVVNFPYSSGVALVRIVEPSAWKRLDHSVSLPASL